MRDLPKIEGPDYAATRRAFSAGVARLAAQLVECPDKPRIRDEWDGASVTMFGLRSTSTSGLYGALVNWCRKVEEKP